MSGSKYDRLLALVQLPFEDVPVPELGDGEIIIIQGMSGIEKSTWESQNMKGKGTNRRLDIKNIQAKLLVRCIVDKPGGQRVYRDNQADALGLIRGDVLARLSNVANEMNGYTEKDIEDLAKNSGSSPSDSSASD